MFAIYRNGSVGFRSTADNLYELKNTDPAFRADLKPDDDTLFQELMNSKDKKNGSKKEYSPQNAAINAYKKVANIDTSERIYHVEDLMSTNCITIDKYTTIEKTYEFLSEKNISQLPVISPENKIIGLINKRFILDLIMKEPEDFKHTLNKEIDSIYLPDLITTDPITDIRRVAKVMVDFRLGAIPVVDENDTLLGIVSKTDILKAVAHLPHLQLWS